MPAEGRPRPKYSELVYNAFWFSPEREALQTLITETQRDETGLVRLKLYKGNIIVAGRKSPTIEGHAFAYDQSDVTGSIELNALRLKLRAALKGSGDWPQSRCRLHVSSRRTWRKNGITRGRP